MKTALNERHQKLGAKLIEFSGWNMPVQYEGIIAEHQAVRKNVGIFDVSHMGRVIVEGKEAEEFLDYLSTNTIVGKKPFTATYTVFCHKDGGSVDDGIIYKRDDQTFFIVVNAGNRQKDLEHFKEVAKNFDVTLQDTYDEEGILAVQGPNAVKLVSSIFKEIDELKPMRFTPITYKGKEIILSTTGYTGEKGCEIYAPNDVIVELWDLFTEKGAQPIGLGARDTLRLEMGFALYGHDLSDDIKPTESIASWTVKLNKQDFLGKVPLEKLENSGEKRSQYGIILTEKGIAREGYVVLNEQGDKIGIVTSGTFSPSLNQAIAIILVKGKLEEGDQVFVQVRKNKVQAYVVTLPFYKKEKK